MVVWENGSMKKDDYKRFRIKSVAGADDFAALGEVLTRRFARALEQGTPLPDLVLIDGGRGQLNVGLKVLQDRSEEHTSELQSPCNLVCRLLLEKKKKHKILIEAAVRT